jgi:hypothetical protein
MTRSAAPPGAAAAGGPAATGPTATAPNGYRAGLSAARELMSGADAAVAAALDRVLNRLRDGAWEGHAAEVWYGELRRTRADAAGVFAACRQACERASAGQPALVDPDDWRAAFDATEVGATAAGIAAAGTPTAGILTVGTRTAGTPTAGAAVRTAPPAPAGPRPAGR